MQTLPGWHLNYQFVASQKKGNKKGGAEIETT